MTNNSSDKINSDTVHEYKVQIDKDFFEAPVSRMTGRELLELADKKPAESYAIYLKVKGGQPERIDLDQKIDLSVLVWNGSSPSHLTRLKASADVANSPSLKMISIGLTARHTGTNLSSREASCVPSSTVSGYQTVTFNQWQM